MRTLVFLVTGILLWATSAMAVNWSKAAGDVYESRLCTGSYDTIWTSTAYDTLAANSDSTALLLRNWSPHPGWEYALYFGALTGTGSDSVSVRVCVRGKDKNGTVLRNYDCDTLLAAANDPCDLGIGGYVFGTIYDVKLVATADTKIGSQLIINQIYLVQRRKLSANIPGM